jgi:hypothetical protein
MGHPDANLVLERFRIALALFELSERMLRQKIRRARPHATDAELDEHVARWLHARPGAEHGDAEGRPIAWPRRHP